MLTQVSLYPKTRTSIPGSLRVNFLTELQKTIKEGEVFKGSVSDRIISDDLEITLTQLGCFEIFGDSNELFDLIPRFIDFAKSKGLTYHWLYLNSLESSKEAKQISLDLVKYFKTRIELNSVLLNCTN